MLPSTSTDSAVDLPRSIRLAAGSMLDTEGAELIEAAAAAGFDGVGLRLSGEHGGHDDRTLRSVAADSGVAITDVEVVRVDQSGRPIGAEIIERAAGVGATHVLAVSDHPGRYPTATAMGALATRCRDAGVDLAIEYMEWTTPSHPAAAVQLAVDIGAVVVIDALHHHRIGLVSEDAAQIAAAGVLGWVQMCDGPHQPFGPPFDRAALIHEARCDRLSPGFGGLPLRQLLASLPADCPVSVEVQSVADGPTGAMRAAALFDAANAVLSAGS